MTCANKSTRGHIHSRYIFIVVDVKNIDKFYQIYSISINQTLDNLLKPHRMSLVKPQLRGLGLKAWTRVLYGSLALSCSMAIFLKYALLERHKNKIKNFYETYDVEGEYQKMKQAGVFKGFENGA